MTIPSTKSSDCGTKYREVVQVRPHSSGVNQLTEEKSEKVLIGLREASVFLDMDKKSIRKAIEAGEIPGVRLGNLFKVPMWWIRLHRDGSASRSA